MSQTTQDSTTTFAENSQLFSCATYSTISQSGDEYMVLISTGSDLVKIKASYKSYNTGSTVTLYSDVTTSDDGTDVVCSCNDLIKNRIPKTKITHSPTVTDTGNNIFDFNLTAANKVRSTVSASSIRLLKPNTKYLASFKANANGAEVQMFLEWSEQ